MTDVKDIHVFPQFVYRAPLMPIETIIKVFNGEIDILDLFSDQLIQEAIYVSSPVLYEEIIKVTNKETVKDKERIIYSFLRFITRMSSRSTPYGLFAGCGVSTIGQTNNILLDRNKIRRKTRLDMFYLSLLRDTIFEDPIIKKNIRYTVNSSLYSLGNRYRYVEPINLNNRQKYQIAEIRKDSALNFILNLLKNKCTADELINHLVGAGITQSEAENYIFLLIDSKIIQHELSRSVTGDDLLDRIIQTLREAGASIELTSKLESINYELKKMDEYPNSINCYKGIKEKIKAFKIPFEANTLFQIDMSYVTSSASINNKIIEEVKSSLLFMSKITSHSHNPALSDFTKAFSNRYEDKEVNFMEVLDTEIGLGYPINNDNDPSPIIDNLVIPQQNLPATENSNNYLQKILLEKTINCLSKNEREIVLTDEDFPIGQAESISIQDTIACMFKVISCKQENDIKIIFGAAGGSSGANILGRFAYLAKDFESFVKDIIKKEQELSAEQVLAEIVYLPESRIGNILFRPHIRDYELVYLSTSDLPESNVIPVSDLMLSVRNGKLYLRSKRLNKEIIPRLTTAHVFNNSVPIYTFLGDMQIQHERSSVFFTWGSLENKLSFRPRVRYRNTVLAEASWLVYVKEIKYLFEIKGTKKLLDELKIWRESISLSRYAYLAEGDNKLLIDFESELCIKSLFSKIKHREFVYLIEFLFGRKESLISNGDQTYLNECIVVFHK